MRCFQLLLFSTPFFLRNVLHYLIAETFKLDEAYFLYENTDVPHATHF